MTTTTDVAVEFRHILARIETYAREQQVYTTEIAAIERELEEERDLERILDGSDTEALERIRAAVQNFLALDDIEKKYTQLGRLFAQLRDVIEQNDVKLRGNAQLGEMFSSLPQASLEAAAGIPRRISEIYDFLEAKGRRGQNPHFAIYTAGSGIQEFSEQLPLDGTRIRGITAHHDTGDEQFYAAGDFLTLLKFDVSSALGKTIAEDATLTIFAEEPQTGGGTLDLWFLNAENADVSLEVAGRSSKGPGPWKFPDGSTGRLLKGDLHRMGCGQFWSQAVTQREQGQAIDVPIAASVVQRWLDGVLPPVLILGSPSYLRFDAWRNVEAEAKTAFTPKLAFTFQ